MIDTKYTYECFGRRTAAQAIAVQVLRGVAFGLGASIGVAIGLALINFTLRAAL